LEFRRVLFRSVDEPINRGLDSLLDRIPNGQDNRLVQPLSNRSNDVLPVPHQQLHIDDHRGNYDRDGNLNAFPNRLDNVVVQPKGNRNKDILPVEDQHLDIGQNSLDHDINGDLDTVPDLQNDVDIQPEGSTHDSVLRSRQQVNTCVQVRAAAGADGSPARRPNLRPHGLTKLRLREELDEASSDGPNTDDHSVNSPSRDD